MGQFQAHKPSCAPASQPLVSLLHSEEEVKVSSSLSLLPASACSVCLCASGSTEAAQEEREREQSSGCYGRRRAGGEALRGFTVCPGAGGQPERGPDVNFLNAGQHLC